MYYEKLTNLGIKLRRRSGSEKTTCPQCSESRRNKKDPCLSVNITNGDYCCHNCSWKGNVRFTDKRKDDKAYQKPSQSMLQNIELNEKVVKYFDGRGISKQTLDKFFIHAKEEWMPQTQKKERCIVFPYMRDTEIVNAKFRDGNKNFKLIKDAELILFGMQTLKGRRCAILHEGEADTLSSYEAGFGQDYELTPNEDGELVEHELGRWATLSVPNGASKGNQRLDYIDNCSDWLADIDEFVLAVDNDEAGIALRDELLRRLGVEKCRFVEYPTEKVVTEKNGTKRACKDMNEVLVHFGKEKVREIVLNSYMLPVEGINYLEDIFESMLTNFRKGVQLAPTTRFKAVDEYFRWKKGDINLFSGYANAGKTTFVLQMMLIKSIYDGWKWAIFSPENYPANDFYDDLVEMYVGKWLDKTSEDEYIEACKFINEHFFYVYPENEHTIEKIHEKFRYLVLKKGIDGALIDPFNQLDKEQKPYEREDQYLSTVLKEVKRFALMNAIVYNIIAHPKNPTYEKDKALPPPNMYDISGGSMWGNKTDGMIIYHRPDIHIDKSSPNVQIHVVKTKRKRTGGKNGEFNLQMIWGCKRFCDPITNEIPCDPIKAKQILLFEKAAYHQENGGGDNDEFAPF